MADRETLMLINVLEGEETRMAVVSGGRLEEFHIERTSRETLVGNVYKGRVENVHASLQAAFVNIGLERNGFLHASEVLLDDRSRRRFRGRRPQIQDMVHVGQEIMVQVIRDGFGEKGPSLTSEISMPGRFLVLTPQSRKMGVSKKIDRAADRSRLRNLLRELRPPRDVGFIIRTAGTETTAQDLETDLSHLLKAWASATARDKESDAPALLYQEADLVIRTIRDIFSKAIQKIVIDNAPVYSRLNAFFVSVMPKYTDRLKYYSGATPLFQFYKIDRQIEELNQKVLQLPSGGTIIIERSEAMYTIDVNSGRFVREDSPELLAFKTNMEAGREVMRQLYLRDMGGIIVIDFIDMKLDRHKRAIEDMLLRESEKDRSQMVILPMSQFCIVQIARQKIRPSLQLMAYGPCPHCGGTGLLKTIESIGLEVIRMLKASLQREAVTVIELRVHPDVAAYLKEKMGPVEKLEQQYGKIMHVSTAADLPTDKVEFTAHEGAAANAEEPAS